MAVMICIALVIGAELANTAIEKIMNFLHPSYHEKIKSIKDIAAGMVLFTAICTAIVGCIIFVPKILDF
jgi:diacylglycerol kinase